MRTFAMGVAMIALATAPVSAQFRESGSNVLSAQSSASNESQTRSSGGGLLGGVFNCSADGNKQSTGAILGGVAGAFLGNRIAGKGNRTVGTLLGGALGAAAGSAVGCKLQKNDRAKAERAAEEALATGQSQTWYNEETGASGRFDVAQTGNANSGNTSSLAGLRFAENVELAANYEQIGNSYTTRSATNIRTSPNTSASIRGTLPAGQRLWVPAQVKGQPWMLIADNGVAQGYVYAPLLMPATDSNPSNCRLVTQTVSVPGESEQAETYQACKGSDGAWTMTKV